MGRNQKINGQSSDYQLLTYIAIYFGKVTSATGQFHQSSHLVPRIAGLGCSLCRLDLTSPPPCELCRFCGLVPLKCTPEIWDSRPCYWSNAFQPARQSRWPFITRNTSQVGFRVRNHLEKSFFLGKKYIECPLKTLFLCNFQSCNTRNMFKICGQKNILGPLPTTSSPELGAARYLPAEWRHHEVWCAWRQLPLPSTMSQELFSSQCLKK